MNITFLGTGANEEIPAFLCKCPVCQMARENKGLNKRCNSSVLVETGGKNILIDLPPGIRSQMATHAPHIENLNFVLISHKHTDHTLGLRHLTMIKKEKGFVVDNFVPLGCPLSLIDRYSKLLDNPGGIDLFILGVYREFLLYDIKILPVETGHLKYKDQGDCYGYIISHNNKRFAYIVDSPAELPKKTLTILKSLDIHLLVLDCTYEKTRPESGHGDIESVIRNSSIINAERTIVTHIGHMNLTHAKLTEALYKHKIEVAYDGFSITL